jgi:hypothetical protein
VEKVKKALLIGIGMVLAAAGRSQEILPVNDLPFELPMTAGNNALVFNNWVKATVISHNPALHNDSAYWFDFDRATQQLIVTPDKKTEFLFDRREFTSVTFHLGISAFTLKHVPVIDDKEVFYEMAHSEQGYSLYKTLRSDSLRSGGYQDWSDYFVILPFPDIRALHIVAIDQRLLEREIDPRDRPKLDRYFALHHDEDPGERFLKGLIDYLNQ